MKTFVICALIIAIPSIIVFIFAGLLKHLANKELKHAQELLNTFTKARHFDVKVASTEILMGWTVLMLVPTDGKTGFYLKTTRRDLKEGDILHCTEIPDHPERAELLKGSQIKPDDSGFMVFQDDYNRLINKIRTQQSEGNSFLAFRQRLLEQWLIKILPACIGISVIVFFVLRKAANTD
ncbi:MAG: hypothetical protein IK130_11680 [Oscillospiraceae bacterium]|nr:hypothetical protein [Oscillospiraceae bacterium]